MSRTSIQLGDFPAVDGESLETSTSYGSFVELVAYRANGELLADLELEPKVARKLALALLARADELES